MSELSEQLLSKVSKGVREPAALLLEDGTMLEGWSCGAPGETFGEICFNTSLEGYLEVISDPSYAGQIVIMTYPQIGNYGINASDAQSPRPALRGLVVHDLCRTPSNWRSCGSLQDYLIANDIVAIEGIDTRSLVRHVRDEGAMKACITTAVDDIEGAQTRLEQAPSLIGANLVEGVSTPDAFPYAAFDEPLSESFALEPAPSPRYSIVAYDCGVKSSILEGLRRIGCDIQVVPWDTPAEEVLALEPDGVFLSNGPGDPDVVSTTYDQARSLLGKVPVFGICLGHQMLCKAAGARMEKLPYGHHGGNHPVMNLLSGKIEITAQNHGFNLIFSSLGELIAEESGMEVEHKADLRHWAQLGIAPVVSNDRYGRIQLTHVNLNDGTAEGIAFLDIPAFSVQFHPEAHPGPTDSHYLFTAFGRLMDGKDDPLDIDIAQDRLEGWRF